MPAWVRCRSCDEYLCTIHHQHVFECQCPPVEDWATDPYMTWDKVAIQRLRQTLGESTAVFAGRFGKSGRTIECWEQGRRNPDVLARRELDRIEKRLRKHQAAIEMGR